MTAETMAPAVAPEVTTPIKPSEALRLGRLTRPNYTEARLWSGETGACALGAILEGIGWGGGSQSTGYTLIQERFPILYQRDNGCPDPDCHAPTLAGPLLLDTTYHLNDDHHWSDAQIGAWLESLGL